MRPPVLRLHTNELIVDNFAGGGGASLGIEMALGRSPDIAVNHDPEAIAMHAANHPTTEHHCESVWDVDPVKVCAGRRVALAWFSPDCKHFSKAKGGKPVEKKIRGLAWVVVKWAKLVKPRVIMLENVEEFQTWGPLAEGQDGKLRPCPRRKGREFHAFRNALQRHGYHVEHRELRACDYGAPTIRKRLFLIARRDGQHIVWPAPTHGDPKSEAVQCGRLKPWRTAAECIDWSLPCPSIFERERPLAEATCRRIAKGVMRYAVNAAEPFIVPLTHHGDSRTYDLGDPFRTVTGANRGELALVTPTMITTGYGERDGQSPRVPGLDKPLGTLVAGGQKHALVTAFLAKHYGGVVGSDLRQAIGTVTGVDHHSLVSATLVGCGGRAGQSRPRGADEPFQTITAKADTVIATSNLIKLRGGGNIGQASDEPLRTISAGGTHFAEVRAFLIKYYSEGGQDQTLADPMHTIPTKDRIGLVTVAGEDYAIADIGLRMLAPKELFAAQSFPPGYIFEWGLDEAGRRITLTKSSQVRLVGNSVPPVMAEALVAANLPEMATTKRRTA